MRKIISILFISLFIGFVGCSDNEDESFGGIPTQELEKELAEIKITISKIEKDLKDAKSKCDLEIGLAIDRCYRNNVEPLEDELEFFLDEKSEIEWLLRMKDKSKDELNREYKDIVSKISNAEKRLAEINEEIKTAKGGRLQILYEERARVLDRLNGDRGYKYKKKMLEKELGIK